MSIPRIIHFSVPASPSPSQLSVIAKARSLHPDWQVMVWHDRPAPDGFRLAPYWPFAGSGAQLADLIRIEVVLKYGGVYLDADVLLHRALDDLVAHCDFFIASEDGKAMTNAAFGATAGHPALADMVNDLQQNPPDWSLSPVDTTGPWFFVRMLGPRTDIAILPRESFYPYNFNERPRRPHPLSYGTHLWDGSWLPKPGRVARLRTTWRASRNPRRLAAHLTWLVWKHARLNEHAVLLVAAVRQAQRRSRRALATPARAHDAQANAAQTLAMLPRDRTALRCELLAKRVLHGGDWCIDVAPGTGELSLLAASIVGPFGRVHAYASTPIIAQTLHASARNQSMQYQLTIANGMPVGVDAAAIAARKPADACTVGNTQVSRIDHDRLTAIAASAHVMRMPMPTLDTDIPIDIPIKLLRIGSAAPAPVVLRGAMRLLERQCVDCILIDTGTTDSEDARRELLACLQEIVAFGYAVRGLTRHERVANTAWLTRCDDDIEMPRHLVLQSHAALRQTASGRR